MAAGKITVVRLTRDYKVGKVAYKKGMRLKVHRHRAKVLVAQHIAEYVDAKPVEFKGIPCDSAGVQVLHEKKAKTKAK